MAAIKDNGFSAALAAIRLPANRVNSAKQVMSSAALCADELPDHIAVSDQIFRGLLLPAVIVTVTLQLVANRSSDRQQISHFRSSGGASFGLFSMSEKRKLPLAIKLALRAEFGSRGTRAFRLGLDLPLR